MIARVQRINDKEFGVFIGETEVGHTKLECDAQFNVNVINAAVDDAVANAEQHAHSEGYDAGYQAGIDYVRAGE